MSRAPLTPEQEAERKRRNAIRAAAHERRIEAAWLARVGVARPAPIAAERHTRGCKATAIPPRLTRVYGLPPTYLTQWAVFACDCGASVVVPVLRSKEA